MKKNSFFCLILSVLLGSCDNPTVLFEGPQPAGMKNETSFPKALMGRYLSLSDSTILSISANTVTRGFNLKYVICRKEALKTKEYTLQKDTLFNKSTNEKTYVVTINDTLYTPYPLQDTLFVISKNNILRKDKGYYFINIESRSGWEVQKIEYKRGKLILSSISNMEEIRNLKSITESTTDSLVKFNPNKDQFRKFIKTKGFSKQEQFAKLR